MFTLLRRVAPVAGLAIALFATVAWIGLVGYTLYKVVLGRMAARIISERPKFTSRILEGWRVFGGSIERGKWRVLESLSRRIKNNGVGRPRALTKKAPATTPPGLRKLRATAGGGQAAPNSCNGLA